FFGQIEIPSLWFIGGFFAYDIFLQSAEHTAGGGGVAHMAHVGGTVFGFGLCFALLALSLLPRDQFDIVALVQRWNKRRQYRDLVSKGFNPFEYAPRDRFGRPQPPDPAVQR